MIASADSTTIVPMMMPARAPLPDVLPPERAEFCEMGKALSAALLTLLDVDDIFVDLGCAVGLSDGRKVGCSELTGVFASLVVRVDC